MALACSSTPALPPFPVVSEKHTPRLTCTYDCKLILCFYGKPLQQVTFLTAFVFCNDATKREINFLFSAIHTHTNISLPEEDLKNSNELTTRWRPVWSAMESIPLSLLREASINTHRHGFSSSSLSYNRL